ncbi:hypothetical protein R3P38DRAFT_1774017 [Favolaschia claudopus]|uniref:Uncharacterized protein n=1 Tax=Favolaschia claudopus TaxID=2862362 RepID=A0AAW0A7L0_9AGAR
MGEQREPRQEEVYASERLFLSLSQTTCVGGSGSDSGWMCRRIPQRRTMLPSRASHCPALPAVHRLLEDRHCGGAHTRRFLEFFCSCGHGDAWQHLLSTYSLCPFVWYTSSASSRLLAVSSASPGCLDPKTDRYIYRTVQRVSLADVDGHTPAAFYGLRRWTSHPTTTNTPSPNTTGLAASCFPAVAYEYRSGLTLFPSISTRGFDNGIYDVQGPGG